MQISIIRKIAISPLMFAVLVKKAAAIQCLLDCKAMPNKAMIEYALNRYDIELAYLLSKKCGADINAVYSSPWGQCPLLVCALCTDKFELGLALIRDGADCKNIGVTSVIGVTGANNIMDYLIGNFYAGRAGYSVISEILQEILKRGYNVNDIWTSSAVYSNDEALKLSLKHGANPNHVFELPDRPGLIYTPLVFAIASRSQTSVKVLLDAGANINFNINQDVNPFLTDPSTAGLKTPLALAIDIGDAAHSGDLRYPAQAYTA